MLREWLTLLTELIVPAIDLLALIIITFGTIEAFFTGAAAAFNADLEHPAFRDVWLRYSRWLIAGLTFLLAADIIETSTAPSWEQIGQLAAIAVIRTFLNFFLERDQRELRELRREDQSAA